MEKEKYKNERRQRIKKESRGNRAVIRTFKERIKWREERERRHLSKKREDKHFPDKTP
jgi:hypothetical protein